MRIDLSCPRCGNNRFAFPAADEEAVLCEMCGGSPGTLGEVKQRVSDELAGNRQEKS